MVQRTCSCTKSRQGWAGGEEGVTIEHAMPRNQCLSMSSDRMLSCSATNSVAEEWQHRHWLYRSSATHIKANHVANRIKSDVVRDVVPCSSAADHR